MKSASSDFWTGLRDNATALALDVARDRLIDVERPGDDRNMPDNVDLASGQRVAANGISVVTVVAIAGAALLGVLLLKRVL